MDFYFSLSPKEHVHWRWRSGATWSRPHHFMGYADALSASRFELAATTKHFPQISSSNSRFSDWIARSFSDLEMMIAGNPENNYPYAGVPWFSTVFGRDGIITALQTLWLNPESRERSPRIPGSATGGRGGFLCRLRAGKDSARDATQ